MKLLAILLMCGTSFAQVVIPISQEDAVKVKATHDALLAAQKSWDAVQAEIGIKYLVVDKKSPDAGERDWYPKSDIITGLTTFTSGSGLVLRGDGVWQDQQCETPEEKAARIAAGEKAKAEREKYEAEREAVRRKIHRGFDSESDFIFSDDWRFLLQKPHEPTPRTDWNFVPAVNLDN